MGKLPFCYYKSKNEYWVLSRGSCYVCRAPGGVWDYTRMNNSSNTAFMRLPLTAIMPSNAIQLSSGIECYNYLWNLEAGQQQLPENQYPSKINPDTVRENTNSKDNPQPQQQSNNVKVPSMNDLKDYHDDLNNATTDDDKQAVIDNWINNITNPSTDPDKPTDPDTPTKPDVPSFNPDDLKPETDFDGIKTRLSNLKLVFPFCIPFDLVNGFKAMTVTGKAPYFEMSFHVALIDYDHKLVIDFNDFEFLAKILRALLTFGWIFGLIKITRSYMIRG